MEEKRIKLPRKYGSLNFLSLSNKDKIFKESNKQIINTEKKIKIISFSENENNLTLLTTADSKVDTNMKKNQINNNNNYIQRKNISRPKANINLSRNKKINSYKKKIKHIAIINLHIQN